MDFRDIELVALRDVYCSKLREPGVSKDFYLRKIFREYSKLFHTPLHVVHDLPMEFVVQAWLEERYEGYTAEDLRQEVLEHLKTHADVMAARAAEDEADADTFIIMEDELRQSKTIKKLEDAVRGMQTALQTFRPRDKDPELTSGKPPPAPVAQGITMRFEDVDLDQDSFGILDTPQFQKKP